jgi:hypothetical protein
MFGRIGAEEEECYLSHLTPVDGEPWTIKTKDTPRIRVAEMKPMTCKEKEQNILNKIR